MAERAPAASASSRFGVLIPARAQTGLLAAGMAGLLLVALFFRWRYLRDISLYVDEFTTMWAAQRILELGVPLMPSGVLYTRGLLASYVEAVFIGALGYTPLVARLPNLLFGLATIPAIYAVGRRHWNARVGWIAAAGLALLPEAIVWSGSARFYAQLQLLVLLTAAAAYASIRGTSREGSRTRHAVFAGLFILALFTQEETILLYPAIVLGALLLRGRDYFRQPAALAAHAACLAAMGLRYAVEKIGQPGYFETIQSVRPYVGLTLDPRGAWATYASLFVAPERLVWSVAALLALVVATTYCVLRLFGNSRFTFHVSRFTFDGQLTTDNRQPSHFHQSTLFYALQFAAVLGAVLLFVGKAWRHPRYLFIVQPFWLLIGAAGVVWLLERILAAPRARAGAAAIAGGALLLAFLPAARHAATAQVEGYDLAWAHVKAARQPGDVVMTPEPPTCAAVLGPCDYYAVQQGWEEYVIRRDGVLVDRWSGAELLNETAQLEAVIRRAPRVWFVLDSLRLATRYEPDFVRTVIEQFDLVLSERGILLLRAEGWRDPPVAAAERDLAPPGPFGPLALTGWSRTDATPGQDLRLTLYWKGAAPISAQYNTFAHLIATDGQRLAQADGPPARGMIPTFLFGPEPLPDPKIMTLPPDLPPGRYRLEVGAYDLASLTPLAATLPVSWFRVGPPPAPAGVALDAEWVGGMRLIGYDGYPATVRPGETLDLRLIWSVEAPQTRDYTVFVQILGPGGTLLAQSDRQPEGGFYPTSAWSTNEPVADTYSLTIPADAAAGSYQLITGLYTPAGRLPLRSGAPSGALPSSEGGAATTGADYVVLGSILVAQ